MFSDYEESSRTLKIYFEGEIDHHTCYEVAKRADDVIRKYLPQVIIFDFLNVTFMDSSGIGMLLGRYKQILRFGGIAKMQNLNNDITRIFKMSGIFKIIPEIKEEITNG